MRSLHTAVLVTVVPVCVAAEVGVYMRARTSLPRWLPVP